VDLSQRDGLVELRSLFPTPSIWPFVSAIATTVLFIGSVFTPWAIVWGSIPVVAALTAWFWPTHRENAGAVALEREP